LTDGRSIDDDDDDDGLNESGEEEEDEVADCRFPAIYLGD